VPMLPSVATIDETVRHMVGYTIVLAATTIALGPVASLGPIYLVTAIAMNLLFIVGAVQLGRKPTPSQSMRLFTFSITYVTILFVAMAIDVFVEHGV